MTIIEPSNPQRSALSPAHSAEMAALYARLDERNALPETYSFGGHLPFAAKNPCNAQLDYETDCAYKAGREAAQAAQEYEALYAQLAERNAWLIPEPVKSLRIPKEARTTNLTDKVLEKQLRRFDAFSQRHSGKRRVLWAWIKAPSRSEPMLGEVLWIRYSNGSCERIPVPEEWQGWMNGHQGGRRENLYGKAAEVFDQLIKPRLPEDQAQRAMKIGTGLDGEFNLRGLRDHPFTPGVREWYWLNTTYSCHSVSKNGVVAPAKFCKFITTQKTLRVQLSGERLLMLSSAGVHNISWGRFPEHVELDDDSHEGIEALIWELAEKKLNAGELEQLRYLSGTLEGVGEPIHRLSYLLRAIQLPSMMNAPVLLEYVGFLEGQAYTRLRRDKPNAKLYWRQLVGNLPKALLSQMTGTALSLAAELYKAGITSADRRAKVINAYLDSNEKAHVQNYGNVLTQPLGWYVALIGEERAAAALCEIIGQPKPYAHANIMLNDTHNMLLRVQGAIPNWEIKKEFMGLQALHDHLMVLRRKIGTVDLPLPSAQDEKLKRLDAVIEHATLGPMCFQRAESTGKLIEYGAALDNCVGSYDSRALRGDIIIVVAKNQEGQALACLEIEKAAVKQYKLSHNRSPSTAEDLAVAAAYLASSGLKAECYDLKKLEG